MGAVHRLDTTTGSFAVKRAFWQENPPEVAEALAEREVDLVERARGVGVRAPRPVRSRGGAVVAHDPEGVAWRVHEFAPGHVPHRSDEDAQQWVLCCGARIHGLGLAAGPGEDVHPFYTTVDVDWADLADRAGDSSADWAPRLAARCAELADLAAWASAAPLGPTRRCHRDLKANNTLLEPDGHRWLLDWEDAGAHDPAREVGTVLLHHVADEGALARLAAAYGAAGGVALPEGAGVFASGIAVWLNFLGGQIGVLLDPDAGAEHRAFATPKVRGLLDDVPDASALERCGRLAARAARDGARTMGV